MRCRKWAVWAAALLTLVLATCAYVQGSSGATAAVSDRVLVRHAPCKSDTGVTLLCLIGVASNTTFPVQARLRSR